jgi:N-formylglutamate amidohydrolase
MENRGSKDLSVTAHKETGTLPSFDLKKPKQQTSPIIYASPHSGHFYPDTFIQGSKLTPIDLRKSEDAFVDELYESCVENGSPLLVANYPRSYVDLNREPYELDPTMFRGNLPSYVNVDSPRVIAGLGTIAKIVAKGMDIYRNKLDFAQIHERINEIYHPYHNALKQLIEHTKDQFGFCIVIDCHSMPSSEPPLSGTKPKTIDNDVVLGDRFGTSCDSWITNTVEASLKRQGLKIVRNRPYAGGFTTQHYGFPRKDVHVLQIELNRRLYMNEETIERNQNFSKTQSILSQTIRELADLKRK